MSNRSGTPYSAPTDADRRPVMLGVSTVDGITPVPLEVNPSTGQLQTSSSGGGGGTSSNFSATFPTAGTAVGAEFGGNMVPLNEDASGNLLVNVAAGGTSGTQYSEGTTTSPGTGTLALGRYDASAPTLTNGKMNSLLLDSSGNLLVNIQSGGVGGTQYTDGGTPPTHPLGTMPIFNNSGTWSQVSASAGLPVAQQGTWSVTANAGTNLNTSALATSSNLTAGTQKTQIVDGSGNVIASTSNALNTSITNTTLAVTESGTWNVGASTATGSTVPATAMYIGLNGVSNNLTGLNSVANTVDAAAGGGIAAIGNSAFNGSTWDRVRTANAAATTTGTGLLGAGNLMFDGTNWQKVSSSNPMPVTISSGNITGFATSANQTNKSQVTQIADGSGNIIASTSNALNVSANITGGSIANTSFAATQGTAANLNATVVGTGTFSVQNTAATPAGTNGIGNVGTVSAVINVNQKTVNTTAVQLSASSTVPTNGIIVQALSTNAASIFVGGSSVTTSTGFELVAGQAMSFTCNLNTLYIISAASTTDKVCYNVE